MIAPAFPCPPDPNEVAIFGPFIGNGLGQAPGFICPALDIDRFVFMDQMPERARLYIQLTNVTADYDMDLVDANTNTILAQALTPGIVNEQIIYDTPQPLQNYYVYVYAKPGQGVTGIPYHLGLQQIPLSANPPKLADPGLSEFKIYPNPAADNVSVQFYTESTQQTAIRVYDSTGRVVLEIAAAGENEQTQTLNVSDLKSGIYRIEASNSEFKKVVPLVKY